MCSQCNKESPNALGQSTSCWMLCKERIRACCCGRKRGRERKRNTSEREGDMQSRLTASLHADASACAGERRSGEVTLLSPSCWAGQGRSGPSSLSSGTRLGAPWWNKTISHGGDLQPRALAQPCLYCTLLPFCSNSALTPTGTDCGNVSLVGDAPDLNRCE